QGVQVILVIHVEDEMTPCPLQDRDRPEWLAAADQEIAQGDEAIVTLAFGSRASHGVEPIQVEPRTIEPGQDTAVEGLGLGRSTLISEQPAVPPVGEVADQIPVIDVVRVGPGDLLEEVERPPERGFGPVGLPLSVIASAQEV